VLPAGSPGLYSEKIIEEPTMVKSKGKKICISLLLISLMAGISHSRPQTAKPEETAPVDKAAGVQKYTFTLSPDNADQPGGYTRQEIESFLCACVPDYIRSEDVEKVADTGKYIVKAKPVMENQKKLAETQEINKWFEDQVTITSKGALTDADIEILKTFFAQINRELGLKKFVYQPHLEVANIVIEGDPPEEFPQVYQYVGETTLLHDNLGIRLTDSDQPMKLKIETYPLGTGKLVAASGAVHLTPAEMEFRKNQRLVKVRMKYIVDPQVRHFAMVHELLHALGFTGHSPYYESHLFPLPVRAYNGLLLDLRPSGRILTPMAERMVEMLYRPELLPGMTIKEAGEILSSLKPVVQTPKTETSAFLLAKKDCLQGRKKILLEKEEKKYNRKMARYIELDRLLTREQWLWDELQEIRHDYGRDADIVADLVRSTSLLGKLVRIRSELILGETSRRWWLEKRNTCKGPQELKKTQRELKRLQEEAVVLNDLLALENEIAPVEREVQAALSSPAQQEINTTLRRILRQLLTIAKELEPLQDQPGSDLDTPPNKVFDGQKP
jgi:hypothetical protein